MASKRSELNWDYDSVSDVLYISFGEPVPAYGEHLDEDILLRFSPDDDQIVGLTVIGFREMGGVDALLKRLKDLVADLRIPLIDSHADELRGATREPVGK
ncbi:MAG: DUF2283 domain-containing protein [Armatimonadia bacterium]|nr:DUF2283 domain-containing protein [Armatimonadia bacterium]